MHFTRLGEGGRQQISDHALLNVKLTQVLLEDLLKESSDAKNVGNRGVENCCEILYNMMNLVGNWQDPFLWPVIEFCFGWESTEVVEDWM